MPRDGSGNYTLPPGNPVFPGTIIEAGWANPTLSDIAAALTDSLSRTGSGGMVASFLNADGSVVAPGMSWTNEPTSGWYRAALNDFWYSVGNENIFRITKTGVELAPGKVATNISSFTAVQDADPAPDMKQGQQWYESDTGGFYMRYVNPDLTVTYISLAAAGGDFVPMSGDQGLFQDGTPAAPGIAWANEPSSGWHRAGVGTVAYYMGGVPILGITPTNVGMGTGVVLTATSGINVAGPASFTAPAVFNSTVSVQEPTAPGHAASKQYVDAIASTNYQIYTGSGSFVKAGLPAGVTHIVVQVWGGGGGGGGFNVTSGWRGVGGGGAGFVQKRIAVSSLAASEPVVVGPGGAGGAAGTPGGGGAAGTASTFAGCVGSGGAGGAGGTAAAAGGVAGGAASGGDLNVPGGASETIPSNSGAFVSSGGMSWMSPCLNPNAGGSGTSPGCGGSCGAATGGAGASGLVIIYW